MITTENKRIKTKNGHTLSSTFYWPEGDSKAEVISEIKGAVLIVPAMGVTQKYYEAFATWLKSHHFLVATFDYSGTGLSLAGNLQDSKVTITDWANFDCAAMIDAVSEQAHGIPLYWIGHSLGGQIFGMVPNNSRVSKVISIAGGSGYWLDSVPSLKWRVWWLWYFVVPLATRIYGYFPGKRLRKVGDLPAGVMKQWRTWCLNPHYMLGVEGVDTQDKYRALATPISSFSFTDDELMSKKNIDSLNSFYAGSSIKASRIAPEEIGTKRIGHFAFFKSKFKKSLWRNRLLPELV